MAAGGQRRLDQGIAGFLRRQAGGDVGDHVVGDHVADPVGAEDQDVTGVQRQALGADHRIDVGRGAERLQDDIVHRAVVGLFLRERAFADQLGDQGLVLAELDQVAIAQQIGAAVADMGEPGLAVAKGEHGAGRAHAAAFRMLLRIFDDGPVGRGEGAGQHLRDRSVEIVIEAADHVGCQRAGHFAGGMAAHAVGDQSEAAAVGGDIVIMRRHPGHRVFVQGAHQPRVGAHGADDFHAGRCLNHV